MEWDMSANRYVGRRRFRVPRFGARISELVVEAHSRWRDVALESGQAQSVGLLGGDGPPSSATVGCQLLKNGSKLGPFIMEVSTGGNGGNRVFPALLTLAPVQIGPGRPRRLPYLPSAVSSLAMRSSSSFGPPGFWVVHTRTRSLDHGLLGFHGCLDGNRIDGIGVCNRYPCYPGNPRSLPVWPSQGRSNQVGIAPGENEIQSRSNPIQPDKAKTNPIQVDRARSRLIVPDQD